MGDGGYVLPDDLDGISAMLSLGVGSEVSFDMHFANMGIPIYQYDPTVDGPPEQHKLFTFNRTAWAKTDSQESRSLASMIDIHGIATTNDAILKFDVEGAEWECFESMDSTLLKHFRIIVCELHGMQRLGNQDLLQQTWRMFSTLTHSHTVVHLHANNCCGISLVEGVPVPAVLELTLIRNDRSYFSDCHDPIPGPLDFPSMDDRPDLVLKAFG